MTGLLMQRAPRRAILGGAVAGGVAVLAGCASMPGYSLTDAIRRLLVLSSERAFARLTQPGGFWDAQVAQVGLGTIMGTRGDILAAVLTSGLFKDRLQTAFAGLAIRGAERAAPIVAEAVRVVGIDAADALVRGGPTAATAFLRGAVGNGLVEAMVPELGQAVRTAQDPVISQVINRLSGIDVAGVTARFSGTVNNAIWQEIGVEEAAIRADPQATRDPLLIAVLGAGKLL